MSVHVTKQPLSDLFKGKSFILYYSNYLSSKIMSAKDRSWKIVTYVPRLLKREIDKNRSSTPFLISISFLISFISSRLWVLLLSAHETEVVSDTPTLSVGKNLVMGGYHIHHITYGVILISIAALLAINYWSRSIVRLSSVLYGAGLGFIVDELGFIIGGIEPYYADTEVFYIAVFIMGLLLSIVYFPSFYKSIKRDIKRWKRIFFR